MESWEAQISVVAALDDPTRRRLYEYVVRQPIPVSRDDAATALDLPRTTAAFHLDRLHAERFGDSPRVSLGQHAYQLGKEFGETARSEAGDHDIRDSALRVLEAYGFQPCIEGGDLTLANCPFHTLVQEYTELVCGMNLRLLDGLLDGLARTGLTAHLDPTPSHCCVRLEPAAPDSAAQRL